MRTAGLSTICVGVAFVALGFYTYVYMGRFLEHARETTAVVVSVHNESATPKGRTHPTLRFSVDGKEVVARADEHHNVKPADTVQLLYDARNPQAIEITTLERAKRRRLLFSGLTAAVGVVVCALGLKQRR